MTLRDDQNRSVRVVFRRGSTVMKAMVLCALVLCMALLITLGAMTTQARAKRDALMTQAGLLEQQNANLKQRIDGLDTPGGIEQIANEELGLVDPDTVIFKP